MIWAEIQSKLAKAAPNELHGISKGSGVPFHTLRKLWSGETQDPQVSTFEKLNQYYQRSSPASE